MTLISLDEVIPMNSRNYFGSKNCKKKHEFFQMWGKCGEYGHKKSLTS